MQKHNWQQAGAEEDSRLCQGRLMFDFGEKPEKALPVSIHPCCPDYSFVSFVAPTTVLLGQRDKGELSGETLRACLYVYFGQDFASIFLQLSSLYSPHTSSSPHLMHRLIKVWRET